MRNASATALRSCHSWVDLGPKTVSTVTVDIVIRDVGLGIHSIDLATEAVPEGREIRFTFYWPEANRWEGADFLVRIASR